MTDAGGDPSPGLSPDPSSDEVVAALVQAQPGGVDDALLNSRLMASMFGVAVPPPRFGRFELRERIGAGGMGVVYRAWDPQLERAVAIKLVDATGLDPSLRERALREARGLAKLSHPHVIPVFEAGLSGDCVWIAMEYVSGATMRQWLTRRPPPDAVTILRQWIAVGRGLVAAHEAGLVHRDVKPSNVLMGDDGRPRLIDFGLVRGAREELSEVSEVGARTDDRVTSPLEPEARRTHGFVGTRGYAAPEQLAGEPVGPAADQYAFCVSVWESLHGRRPSSLQRWGDGAGDPRALERPEGHPLPSRVHRALVRGLALEPSERFASLGELLDELEAAVAKPSRWLSRLLAAATLGAVAAGAGVVWLHEPAEPTAPCAIEASALSGTWDDARREALRRRVEAGALPFALVTFASLERELDQWSERWLEARRAACAATRIEGVQSEVALDLRQACLERKRRAVQVGLDALLEVDEPAEAGKGEGEPPGLAAKAPALLGILPGVDDCADPERLAEIEPLPPAGPGREAMLRGYDVLAEARALAAAGSLLRAETLTRALAEHDPEALAYVPLRLELEAFPAQLELLRERIGHGVPELVRVAREAEARRLDELAATLLVEAADTAAGRWSKPELERWLVDEAETALRRLARDDDPRAVVLRVAEAKLLAQAGRLEEALAAHLQARAHARRLQVVDRAMTHDLHVAAMLEELNRFDEARQALEAGRERAEQRWGPGSPTVGRYEFDLALLALETGDFEAAGARFDRTERLFEAAFGRRSLWVARVRFARAKLHMIRGEFEAASICVEEALGTYAEVLGPEHELLVELHEARGVLRYFSGDLPGSIESYQAALRIQSSLSGPEHFTVARLHSNLAESWLALGRLDEARAGFERALGIYERVLPADHPDVALPLKGRGQVALAQGRLAEAIEDLERALALQLAVGSEPLEIADLRFSLARALVTREGAAVTEAEALARQARRDFERRGMHEQVAEIDAWLAR